MLQKQAMPPATASVDKITPKPSFLAVPVGLFPSPGSVWGVSGVPDGSVTVGAVVGIALVVGTTVEVGGTVGLVVGGTVGLVVGGTVGLVVGGVTGVSGLSGS